MVFSWRRFFTRKAGALFRDFCRQSQEDLTQALGLVTDGKVPLDKNGAQQWPKVGDSADFLLTPAACTAEFVARKGFVSKSFYQGTVVFSAE